MLLRWLMSVAVFALGMSQSAILRADDPPAAQDPVAEWKAVNEELAAYKTAAEDLRVRFTKAPNAEKSKIRKEFDTLSNKFQTKTMPRLIELAPLVYQKNPDDTVAAELTIQTIFSKNQFDEVVKIADKIVAKEPKSQIALNYGGMAKFANQDFEGAKKMLEAASDAGVLIDGMASSYLDNVDPYIKYWEEEKAIRAKEDAATGDAQLPIVKLQTSRGDIEILLFEDEAPNTVANFISLTEKKFYDGIRFHRILPVFMTQGGCPDSRENLQTAGSGGPGYLIDCECYSAKARRHFAGSISMAHAGKDTGGSQFFLTHLPTAHLNTEPGKDQGNHTVFGRVIKGLDIVRSMQVGDEILQAVVVRKRNHEYKPVTKPDPRGRKPE